MNSEYNSVSHSTKSQLYNHSQYPIKYNALTNLHVQSNLKLENISQQIKVLNETTIVAILRLAMKEMAVSFSKYAFFLLGGCCPTR